MRVMLLTRRVAKDVLEQQRAAASKEVDPKKCSLCEQFACTGECCEGHDHLRTGCQWPPDWFAQNFGNYRIDATPTCEPCDETVRLAQLFEPCGDTLRTRTRPRPGTAPAPPVGRLIAR
eukprot:2510517-Prymnesium_polylepis.1